VADSLVDGIAMAKVFMECLIRRKMYPFQMTEGGAGRGTGHSTNWSEAWLQSELNEVRSWLKNPRLLTGESQIVTNIFGPRGAVRRECW
jgi:hypothetical protein